MELKEAIRHAREVASGCDGGSACAYQNDKLADWLEELVAYKDAEEQGRLPVLPCKVGDTIFSFRWNAKIEEYEVYGSVIKNVRYDSADGSVMVSDGERFHVWGKRAFSTREEAEKALK